MSPVLHVCRLSTPVAIESARDVDRTRSDLRPDDLVARVLQSGPVFRVCGRRLTLPK